ncbi:hypothetical protein BJ085DRAFT_40489 [Dimargaris cristalligena]|uniref:Uncharacterized protein n=1 Tax=Dimargaris cristalligena TaxID=215637 RepID=A0A4V1J573_9FUNG|nr:hypothetical protein BJ085DRAFT_40489 [Dimargaris cristalligena]|eukprot:RKP38059.1 hypothetical protein BJ085DRAFT_40489 [Dimargaris cristalligena]
MRVSTLSYLVFLGLVSLSQAQAILSPSTQPQLVRRSHLNRLSSASSLLRHQMRSTSPRISTSLLPVVPGSISPSTSSTGPRVPVVPADSESEEKVISTSSSSSYSPGQYMSDTHPLEQPSLGALVAQFIEDEYNRQQERQLETESENPLLRSSSSSSPVHPGVQPALAANKSNNAQPQQEEDQRRRHSPWVTEKLVEYHPSPVHPKVQPSLASLAIQDGRSTGPSGKPNQMKYHPSPVHPAVQPVVASVARTLSFNKLI